MIPKQPSESNVPNPEEWPYVPLKRKEWVDPLVHGFAEKAILGDKSRRRFELVKAALSGTLASPTTSPAATPEQIADGVVQIADAVMARLGE